MADQPAAQLQCPLQFDTQPRTALLLRLTPQLRAALAEAQASGLPSAIRISGNGSPNVSICIYRMCILKAAEGVCSRQSIPERLTTDSSNLQNF